MERVSSVVERRTRNHMSPGSNPLCYRFDDWTFSLSSLTPLLTQLYRLNDYLAIASGGNVSDLGRVHIAKVVPEQC